MPDFVAYPPLREEYLSASDGLRLLSRWWQTDHPKAVLLLAHGIGEHSGRYESLGRALSERGLAVGAIDHRGHGRSEGRRGDCHSMDDFVQDFAQLVQSAQAKFPALPRFLLGHSLGGLIALTFCIRYPREIQGLVLSSPAFRLAQEPPKLKLGLARSLSLMAPTTPLPNGIDPTLLSHDSSVVESYRRDPLVHRVVTARCGIALRRAMGEWPRLAENLETPCLLLQAGSDRICDPKAAAEFVRATREPVTFRLYEGLYHELFNEPQRAQVIQDLCRWMEDLL